MPHPILGTRWQVALGVGALAGGATIAWAAESALSNGSISAEKSVATSAGVTPSPQAAREGEPPAETADPLRVVGGETSKRQLVPPRGTGKFAVVPVASGLAPDPEAETYRIEIEGGVKVKPAVVAQTVDAVLADRRGWRSAGHTLTRTDGEADFRIVIASPKTTDDLCAPLETEGRVSCHNSAGDVVLNARRWTEGIPDYRGALVEYRTYLINHEVGHHLGYSHEECGGAGEPAPVMMQQTYGLRGCSRNVWPS